MHAIRWSFGVAVVSFLAACSATPPAPEADAARRVDVPLLAFRLTPAEVESAERTARARADAELAAIVAIADGSRTHLNTVEGLDQATARYFDAVARLAFLAYVHTDAAVRGAASKVEEVSGKYAIEVGSRRDLYRAVKSYAEGPGRSEQLDPQQARLLELTLRQFRRNGLALSDADLARLVALRGRITELQSRFALNLNENTDSIAISRAEAAGLPKPLLARLKKTGEGGYVVTMKYPDYYPFMEDARSEAARKRAFVKFNSREAAENIALLREAVRLRDEAARLLGYQTHADYVLEDRMAKRVETVAGFLGSLREQLRPRLAQDLAKLTALKRAETGDARSILQPWDISRYFKQLKQKEFALDPEALREYFPVETVTRGLFEIYQTLLGIRIEAMPEAETWAPGVTLHRIRDSGDGRLLGYLYLDLHPREGKYGHAACWNLNHPRQTAEGYVAPIAAMVANFTPPSADRPALLTHGEAETYFHEFGHAMHQVLTEARYASQAGFYTDVDFVEAPSQMLENWLYERESLDLMTGHYQRPAEKLPAEVVERIRAARTFDAGWFYTRQVYLAAMDQALHTAGPVVDPDALDRKLYRDYLTLEPAAEAHFPATLGHLMGGYDAGLYSYLWSDVYAADMFTRFEAEGVLNPAVGRQYRHTVLARGRSVDAEVLLQEFLGRRPQNDAFLRQIGLGPQTAAGR